MTNKTFAAGALRVKKALPASVQQSFDMTRVLDKDGVKDLIADIVTHGGKDAPQAISEVSKLFFDTATFNGYSTPLSDYLNDSEERDALIKEFESQVDMVNNDKNLTDMQKAEKLGDITSKYQSSMTGQNLDFLLSKGSTAAAMAETGARGNPQQLQQATSTPLISKGIGGKPIPLAITRSFAEGLTPAEHMAMSHWGRSNTVSAQLATSEPGAMFKRIAPNLYHDVVTVPDCGTRNGIVYKINDRHRIIGRYETGTNKLVDEQYYNELVNSGKKNIKVRSTLSCEAHEGVCQRCYGRNPEGKQVGIGENVGMVAAQSVSEKLTQMILSTKHDAKAGKGRNPFYETKNLLDNPGNFQDEATIARLNGEVTDIVETALGDHKVYVNGEEHFVPNVQKVIVKKGQNIKQGSKLSTGTINPKQLVNLRGLGEGRRYLTNKMEQIYGVKTDSSGTKSSALDTRHFDLVARNLMKYVEVEHPGETDFLPGQKVNINKIYGALKKDVEEVPLTEAEGRVLAIQVLELMPGTVLDSNHLEDLRYKGVESVKVSKTGMKVKPFVPGITTLKSFDPNWISRMTHKGLQKALEEGAALGHTSDIHSTDPIAPYVMGTTFGEGKNGRY